MSEAYGCQTKTYVSLFFRYTALLKTVMQNGMPEGADQAEKRLLPFITRQLYGIVLEQYVREHMVHVRKK